MAHSSQQCECPDCVLCVLKRRSGGHSLMGCHIPHCSAQHTDLLCLPDFGASAACFWNAPLRCKTEGTFLYSACIIQTVTERRCGAVAQWGKWRIVQWKGQYSAHNSESCCERKVQGHFCSLAHSGSRLSSEACRAAMCQRRAYSAADGDWQSHKALC